MLLRMDAAPVGDGSTFHVILLTAEGVTDR
jgi:hypothetical protein